MHHPVGDTQLLRACLVGVYLEPRVSRRTPVKTGDCNGWDPACEDLVKDPRAPAYMLTGTILADEAAVLQPVDSVMAEKLSPIE